MALVIGLIASMDGLATQGSAELLGRQVTSSVVKSIFMVIVMDGVFAVFFAGDRLLSAAMTSSSADANVAQPRPNRDVIISVRDLVVGFGDKTIVMKGLNLDVYRGEVLGFVGGSGQGKSVLTRTILGLTPMRRGSIRVFGQNP